MRQDLIYRTVRSIFRFNLISSENYPEFLLNEELKIFFKNYEQLNVLEKNYIIENYQTLLDKEKTDFELSSYIIMREVNREMSNLN